MGVLSGLLLPLMFLVLLTSVPIAFAIGLTVIIVIVIWQGIPMTVVFQQFYQGLDSFTFLAIPLFMVAGEIMTKSGITDDLLGFCDILVGKLKGGLGYVNVLANVFFAAICGSAIASMAAIAPIMAPKMEEKGFTKEFSLALSAAGSVIGPIIPPSILMVIYSTVQSVSVGAMFIGGIIPGLLMGLALMVIVAYVAKKENIRATAGTYTREEVRTIVIRAIPAALTPFVVLGGIFSGWFSPTEAAGILCIYAVLLGVVYYRKLTFRSFMDALIKGFLGAIPILLIIAVARPFAWLVAMAQLPTLLADAVTAITSNQILILLLVNIIFLLLGCVMEGTANCLIFVPIFAPLVMAVGVDPLHFGVVIVINMLMAVATPPFGISIFLGANIGKIPVERIYKPLIPLIAAQLTVLLLCTYIPSLVTGLPKLLGIY